MKTKCSGAKGGEAPWVKCRVRRLGCCEIEKQGEEQEK